MDKPGEKRTSKELINPASKKAGWDINNHAQVGLEIPVDNSDVEAWKKLEKRLIGLKQRGGSIYWSLFFA